MSAGTTAFYVTGGTVPHGAPSYVPRQADTDLYEGLVRGEFCYVLTSRQMGKSSLMVRVAARLREAGIAVAILDLTAIGQTLSAEQWYEGLLLHLGQYLGLEDELDEFWLAHDRWGPLQRWREALREVVLKNALGSGLWALGKGVRQPPDHRDVASLAQSPEPRAQSPELPRIVIFIDEIDTTQSLPFSTDEFFAAIRECYNRRAEDPRFNRLTFCLLGVASPSDLIRDTRITPFNIGRRIELTDFTEAETAPLAEGLVGEGSFNTRFARDTEDTESTEKAKEGKQEASVLLRRVLYWTGGHPYLTQRLCRAIADARTSRPSLSSSAFSVPSVLSVSLAKRVLKLPPPNIVDRLCDELFLTRKAREIDDNLVFVRDRLLQTGEERAAVLDLYRQVWRKRRVPDDEANPLASLLKLSGIARAERGLLRVRNRIYRRVFDPAWVRENLPDAEVRRQRAAYWRGVLRTATLAAVIVAAIGSLALVATSQARRANRLARQEARQRHLAEDGRQTLRRYLYAAETNLALQAWQTGALERSRQLLEAYRPHRAGEEDLRDFAWRHLWYLQRDTSRLTLSDHVDYVRAVAFSPDGRRLASGGDDGVKLWDLPTPSQRRPRVRTLTTGGVDKRTLAVAFSPDGRTLASGGDDRTLRLWDVATARQTTVPTAHRGTILAIAFSPDGKTVATGGAGGSDFDNDPGEVRVWDLAIRRLRATFPGHSGAVRSLAFLPDGRTLIAAGGETMVHWDLPTKRALRRVAIRAVGRIQRLATSPDGRTLAVVGWRRAVALVDTATGRLLGEPLRGHTGSLQGIAFSPDGRSLASGGADSTVRLWDLATRRQTALLLGHQGQVSCVHYSPDGRTIASGSGDGSVKLWDLAPAPRQDLFVGNPGPILRLTFSSDGKRLATADFNDGTAHLWDVASRRPLVTLARPGIVVFDVAISPDGKTIATAEGSDYRAKVGRAAVGLWDAASGTPRAVLRGHRGPVVSVAFSPDGRTLASASFDYTVRLWDAATGRPLAVLSGHRKGVVHVAFSPDGKTLASASYEPTVKLWDVPTRTLRTNLEGHSATVYTDAFSPDGRTLASCSGDLTLRLWDLTGGGPPRILRGHTTRIGSVAFSPDGRTLATTGWDDTVKLWNLVAQREVATFPFPEASSVAFSPDGRLLAASGRTVRLWQAATFAETDPLRVVAHGSNRSVTLQWRPLPTASGYQVYRGPDGTAEHSWTRLGTLPPTAEAFTDPDLPNGRPRTYAVAALLPGSAGQVTGPRVTLHARPVATPPGFQGTSINEGSRPGSVAVDAATGRITLRGSGSGFAHSPDGLYFLNRAVTGDCRITLRQLTRPTPTYDWAHAGLMLRELPEAGARYACLIVTAKDGFGLEWRSTPETARPTPEGRELIPRASLRLPLTLRLTRRGEWIEAAYSRDGRRFEAAGNPLHFEGLAKTVYVGPAIASLAPRKTSEATFQDLQILPGAR